MNLISSQDSKSPHHVVFFPFMAKGHTIPLLHFLRLLRRRFPDLSLTVFTTAVYRPFISQFLSDDLDSISLIDISFPQNAPGLPAGVESMDSLPEFSLFPEFCTATKLMQPQFEELLQSLLPVTFLISDMFFWWTVESASKFDIPRICFSGMSNFCGAVTTSVMKNRALAGVQSDDEMIPVVDFPWLKVCRGDWGPAFWPETDPTSLHSQFIRNSIQESNNSYGTIVNSFYEMEAEFIDYNEKMQKVWNIGPLCIESKLEIEKPKSAWLDWLNEKQSKGKPVIYVAFGSQAEIESEQMKEIEIGLEESGVNFLWVLKKGKKQSEELEEKENGIVVREWVDQWEILNHENVKGFLSHCGWNSVVESLSCGVPILAFPLMAEQSLNARMVVDELKIGLMAVEENGRLLMGKGTTKLVKGKDLQRLVRELMAGEKGKELRKKAMEISVMAKKAMAENGSSWKNLELLVEEMCNRSYGRRSRTRY